MNLVEMLSQAQGQEGIQKLASQFGISGDQAQQALGALGPQLAKVTQGGGLDGLIGMLTGGDTAQVAQGAAAQSGLSANLLQSMLPVIVSMLSNQQGGLGGLLGGLLGGANAGSAPTQAPAAGGGLLGGLGNLLDSNRDGNVMDDLAGLAGNFLNGRK